MSQYWAACYTTPQTEPIACREIEGIGIGAFLPSFTRYFYKGGQLRERQNSLLPGYVFVCLEHGSPKWGEIEHLERASIRVLKNAGEPVRIPSTQVADLMLNHAMGARNVIEQPRAGNGQFASPNAQPQQKKRRPRPRACKSARARRRKARRAREATHRNHTDITNLAAA